MDLLDPIDPRLQGALRAALSAPPPQGVEPLPHGAPVVLVGHRAAGKSSLLRPLAQRLGLPAVDLDAALEARHLRPLRTWLAEDAQGFRAAERALLEELLRGERLIAAGGGVLSLHADALVGAVPVLVPLTFETYLERLRADSTRPRLRPELTLEDELREVFHAREQLHAKVPTVGLVELLQRHAAGRRARRLVTLPPGEEPSAFAARARAAGAELLEVRTDLTPLQTDLSGAARVLPLLVAERGAPIPAAWSALATLADREDPMRAVRALAAAEGSGAVAAPRSRSEAEGAPDAAASRAGSGLAAEAAHLAVEGTQTPQAPAAAGAAAEGAGALESFHSPAPLDTEAALAAWASTPVGARVKHVEPLGAPAGFPRLLATQAALLSRFGAGKVTVLATGPLALPFRAVLAQRNALDYLALDGQFAAAPGQRLLRDAVREARAARGGPRLGILGSRISGSRSPAIHPQPFDRIDLPSEAPIVELVEALRPHYRGFAVTSPFKKPLAQWLGFEGGALNTLWRTEEGFGCDNTDVAGALRALESLLRGGGGVTVLGDGGAAVALRQAAARLGAPLTALRWQQALGAQVDGAAVWTWPPHLGAPAGLRLGGAPVAVIAYGAAGKAVAQLIRGCGGAPVRLGARWFIAQARAQRTRWETAR